MPETKTNGDLAWGVFLLLVGLFFLISVLGIPSSAIVGNDDPGPTAVPIAMSVVLLAGGAASLITTLWHRPHARNRDRRTPLLGVPERRVLRFAALTLGYVICVPFAFYASTFLFCLIVIWWLGARWWTAAFASAAITAVVWGLFVRMFLVPLPTLLETLSQS